MANKHLYFTDDFFTSFLLNINKLFKENYLKHYSNSLNFFIGVALTLSLCLSGLYLSYSKNSNDLQEISRLLTGREYKKSNRQEQLSKLSHILAEKTSLENRLYFLTAWAVSISKSLDNNLKDNINNDLIPALVIFLENELTKTLHNGDIKSLLEAFKVYLMILRLEPIDPKYIKNWYLARADHISMLLGISSNLLTESLVKMDIKTLQKTRIDRDLSIRVLALFDSSNLARIIYNFGVSRLGNKPDINPVNILPESFLNILSPNLINTAIPYAYTKEGYQEYSGYSMKILKEVIGITYLNKVLPSGKLRDSIQEANSMYMSDYAANWGDFLFKIQFKEANNLKEALHIVKRIQSNISLIFKFLKQVDKDVSVIISSKTPLTNLQNQISENSGIINMDELSAGNRLYGAEDEFLEYKPLDKASIANIQEKLLTNTRELTEFLSSILVRENLNAACFELAGKIESTEESPITKIDKTFQTFPSPLDFAFGTVIDNIKRLVYKYASNHINQSWEAVIYKFYTEKIQNKYPINSSNYNNQLLVKDFMTFFSKSGLLDGFATQYLSLKGITLNKQAKELMKFAEIVRKYWFNDEGQLQIQFTITPTRMESSLSKVILSMVGTEITFARGNFEPSSLVWPGKIQNSETELTKINFINNKLKKALIYYNGSWAWYRFLELDNYNFVLSGSNSINNIIKSPLGDFEFSVTFNGNIPLLDEKNFFVPQRVVEATNNEIKIYE
jgi:type VI secretion system protein ImpL